MKRQTWGACSLASAAAWAMLVGGASGQIPGLRTKPAAGVDGTAISMAEVEALIKQAGTTATAPTEGQRRQMQRDALNMLIDDLLMQQFLKKNGPKIEPAEVEKRLKELDLALEKQTPKKSREDF